MYTTLSSLPSVTGDSILRLPQIKARCGLSRASIYAGVKNGTFPAPVKLGERAVGWLASSIDAWIQSRAQSVRPGASA
ncbi:AlpA family transcriptional regulator [Pseudoduganella sp. SL102]|uniref:helix-turn-helix transcriptional regulator n=1 Tax=Pseudoduganella sp. SL102 TaxID=2995154 RepID=UPI00248BF24A|nr:AlpA family transcriptional regulator [Pseudoduganella sp. SL102]WBS02372.1 AlpA family transcriptional regulator [Pseudoduganella sp. SL102]